MNVRLKLCTFALGLLLALPLAYSRSFPLSGGETVLPPGTELNEDALARPREVSRSELIGGRKSYLVNLGDVAFNSPSILGGAARQAAMSCGTCHVNGASNPRLFIPGMSTRPGNFDTTSLSFNPKAFNSLLDPVRIPSLRGARYLAPYGHDGRFASLSDFVRNVIVNEFAGPEPAPAIVDHLQHNVGTGGLIKTPTLLNANFNGPYFHDGRYDSYDQVVEHFDGVFDLGLSAQEKQNLVAYLTAVGDGERPYEGDGVALRMKEISDFASVLELAIPARDAAVVSLVVTTVDAELRELAERFPDHRNATVADGQQERRAARMALKELVLMFRQIELAASAGRFDQATAELRKITELTFIPVPALLKKAEPWSLFNAGVHDAHYGALGQMLQSAA